jgi:hypothetical protein
MVDSVDSFSFPQGFLLRSCGWIVHADVLAVHLAISHGGFVFMYRTMELAMIIVGLTSSQRDTQCSSHYFCRRLLRLLFSSFLAM